MNRSRARVFTLIIAGACGFSACSGPAPESLVASQPPLPLTKAQDVGTLTPAPKSTTLAPPNEASTEFMARLDEYLALRTKVENSMPKLTTTNDPKNIAERAAKLAAGLAAARKDATQGVIFTAKVAAEFRRILAADAASRTPQERADLMTEVPATAAAINGQYPIDSPTGPLALPSFPPNLLAVLPELPDTVEYRFLGTSLVLRDASANLIVDYLTNVAPGRVNKD